MMLRYLFLLPLALTQLFSAEFSVASYNCGGLPDHYDYIRTIGMQKLSQERVYQQPEDVTRFQELLFTALESPISSDDQAFLDAFLNDPSWSEKSSELLTSYRERPVVIHDDHLAKLFDDTIRDLTRDKAFVDSIDAARRNLAKRIFAHHVTQDIICLQEANYLDSSLFPETYTVDIPSAVGVAWNKTRFELVEVPNRLTRAHVVKLRDKESGELVLVASAHLTGCDPFKGGDDSTTGDKQLQSVLKVLNEISADIKLVAMDANVTALHPRLSILREAGFQLDTKNLEPTCTHPTTILDTRIDWIAIHGDNIKIVNVPVQAVGLNSPQTNMSDHKPIAAKISSW